MREKVLNAITQATAVAAKAGSLSQDVHVTYTSGSTLTHVSNAAVGLSADVPDSLKREDIELWPGARCFMLHNLLSNDECKQWIDSTQLSGAGYAALDKEFPPHYRNNDRWVFDSRVMREHRQTNAFTHA
jgi:hypothetical protein